MVAHGSLLLGLLTMAPALALAAVLLTRRYPGERVIVRLRTRRLGRRTAAARPSALLVRSRRRELAHGGRLIAVSLAGRAPPGLLAGCRR
jgi:hypothetical protein